MARQSKLLGAIPIYPRYNWGWAEIHRQTRRTETELRPDQHPPLPASSLVRRAAISGGRRIGWFALLIVVAVGCASSPAHQPNNGNAELQGDLTIFAAASLTEAFNELGQLFESDHPGASVRFNYAGSQRLRTQLEYGAQADLFASADWIQMRALMEQGLILGQPIDFTGNQLVILVPEPPITSGVSGISGLDQPGLKLVLALPEVPAGRYTRAFIDNLRADPRFGEAFAEGLLANVVSREANVRGVAQKVAMGEADAGITYVSDAQAPFVASRVRQIPIPSQLNETARYPIATLSDTAQPELAQAFIELLRSETGQNILARHGFTAPTSASSSPALEQQTPSTVASGG